MKSVKLFCWKCARNVPVDSGSPPKVCPWCGEPVAENLAELEAAVTRASPQYRNTVARSWLSFLVPLVVVAILSLYWPGSQEGQRCQQVSVFSLRCPRMPESIFALTAIVAFTSGLLDCLLGVSFGLPRFCWVVNRWEHPRQFIATVVFKLVLIPVILVLAVAFN